MQHLEEYGLPKERDAIRARISEHNRQLDESLKSAEGLPATERDRFVSEQSEVWKEVRLFATKLQEVVNNLEDNELKGECDYERRLKKELGL